MSSEPDVQELMALFDANCAAFSAKDLAGYFDSVHPSAWTYQGGAFASVEALRAVAPAILESSERFEVTRWIGGVVVGDTGAIWGEFEFDVKNPEGGTSTSAGSFSAHYTRVDGSWNIVFTHYTPAPT